MVPFKHLTEDERWALAFHVANLGIPAERLRAGKELWQDGKAREAFPDLGPVATLSTDEVAARHGEAAARVQDYLRANPSMLRPAPLAFSRPMIASCSPSGVRSQRSTKFRMIRTA